MPDVHTSPRKRKRYRTKLEQWKRELSAELERDVTYIDIESETGIAYSTLMKHATKEFKRPDYGIAAMICDFFNKRSEKRRTPLEYFEEVSDQGQPMAVATVLA